MIAAAEIKCSITIWALIAARHILRDGELISAGATQNRRLVPLLLRPDLNRVACQRLVTLLAGIIDAATFHPDGDDIELGSEMIAACRGIEINPANFSVWR